MVVIILRLRRRVFVKDKEPVEVEASPKQLQSFIVARASARVLLKIYTIL